jgi:hypothetical protein
MIHLTNVSVQDAATQSVPRQHTSDRTGSGILGTTAGFPTRGRLQPPPACEAEVEVFARMHHSCSLVMLPARVALIPSDVVRFSTFQTITCLAANCTAAAPEAAARCFALHGTLFTPIVQMLELLKRQAASCRHRLILSSNSEHRHTTSSWCGSSGTQRCRDHLQLYAPIADCSKQREKHAVGEPFANKWKETRLYPLNEIGTECCCNSSSLLHTNAADWRALETYWSTSNISLVRNSSSVFAFYDLDCVQPEWRQRSSASSVQPLQRCFPLPHRRPSCWGHVQCKFTRAKTLCTCNAPFFQCSAGPLPSFPNPRHSRRGSSRCPPCR